MSSKSLLEIDVLFESPLWGKSRLGASKIIRPTLETVWKSIPHRPRGIVPEITITLTDDASIAVLNKNYRSKNKPTNVLSFPMWNKMADIPSHAGEIPAGDIIIAFETIHREAKEQGKSLHNHFTHMLTHGFLHLFGYDHIDDREAEEMESLEIAILRKMGISNPYE